MTGTRATSDPIPELDVHVLAALPGFGRAREALKAVGAWDEYAAAGREREFTVCLEGTVEVSGEVIIKARCEAEAEELALQLAERGEVIWEADESTSCIGPIVTDILDSDC